jgi:hypothetical protein
MRDERGKRREYGGRNGLWKSVTRKTNGNVKECPKKRADFRVVLQSVYGSNE